ncbi:glycosyl transferase [Ascobolus immersus RN42]|uniref:Glycosyl transferase n=1 Tax=Ascobolus immersus RN42 TaxID=1160509 RepID=A0A3N4IQJ4_ASCIM|nr:glycosyl transferase [Ascobolus immersus RN42]
MIGSRAVRFILTGTIAIVLCYQLFALNYVGDIKWRTEEQGQSPQFVDQERHTGNVSPALMNLPEPKAPGPRANATFVTLARNQDIWEIAKAIRSMEDRFNHKFNYDWVFLNDRPFNKEFKRVTTQLTSGKAKYGQIPKEHWSFPSWIDQDKAREAREEMSRKQIIYGDSISYRHMCRFESGFFFRHELLMDYEYYWRVEPSVEFFCDINYDPFMFMKQNNKKYSFVLSPYEYVETIPTLWNSTKKFMAEHPEHIHPNNSMAFISDDGGKTYNNCHFWSNFEIASLDMWRSKPYLDFFESLDKDGGFFYERWGDAPVHTIAASLLLDKNDIHFWDEIGYYHAPFTHCPTSQVDRERLKCSCNPNDNFDWKGWSCLPRHFKLLGKKRPEGWETQQDE